MEQTSYVNLPVIGRVQHGEQVTVGNGKKRAKELGYFIAKVQDQFMQGYLQKFDQMYKGKKFIEVEFITEEPFSAKYSRSNQSGQVCYCKFGTDDANQKVQNGWQKIKCLGQECQYRQKKQIGSPDCKKVGWLKFLIPKISTDRIWLMKITSGQAVDALNQYFSLQKEQGHSVKGRYILFLKQVENSKDGKTFNNYIIDIIKKENFISNSTPTNKEISQEQSTTNEQIVNNIVKDNMNSDIKMLKEEPKKKSTKKEVKKATKIEISENPNVDKCYYFINHHTETFMKDGKPKEYFIGEFYDMDDKPVNFIIKPELIDGILECNIGSVFEAEIQEFKGKKILTAFKFVQNNEKDAQKKIAA